MRRASRSKGRGRVSHDRPRGSIVGAVATDLGAAEVLVGLKGLVTAEQERTRVKRELGKLGKDLAAIDKKLGSPNFVEKAPKEVVEEARTQRAHLVDAQKRLEEALGLADELDEG